MNGRNTESSQCSGSPPSPRGDLRRSTLLLTCIATILATSCTPRVQPNVFRLGYKPTTAYQLLFIANHEHFFDHHGLQVRTVSFESTNEMMNAVINGELDGTAAGSIESIALVEQNSSGLLKIALTQVFDAKHPFLSILVPPDSPIQTLDNLKGRRVATVPGPTGTSLLVLILSHFFDAKHDVSIVQLEPRLQIPALVSHQVDALYTVDPTVTLAVTTGVARVLAVGPENRYVLDPLAAGAAVIATRKVREQPAATAALVGALNDAIDFERTHEQESRKIIAQDLKLTPDVASRMPLFGYWKLTETDLPAVQRYLDLLQDQRIISKHIDARALYLSTDLLKGKTNQ